ncbi:DNA internalization-related competence protein ComEC/Rec2 [Aquincola sp. S2]|uniref:DNA internalization-related competence protein ComEC/Rec2 n=1 Tax=Pseudaquabacterium terrae TaxID=2732868 RepID=A0ABX2EN20_9BURK|nr:DNA internalization-related competence protein ComEC/Rec2 [Aquabacterium terrae]NRF70025.1 DNA internalization-related competence protein ComEC/Rec2 [Aquabacterium terrae]
MPIPGTNPGWRIAAGGGAWLGGVALQLQQPALWPIGSYGLLLGIGLALLLWAGARRRLGIAAVLGLALLAFASTGGRASLRLAEQLDPALEGRDLVLTGVIAALPNAGAAGTRFLFEVEQASAGGAPVDIPGLISLGWYSALSDDEPGAEPRSTLRAGQRWRLPVRLKQPHGVLNPGGFDVELWLWERGVRATGSVRAASRGAAAPMLLAEGVAHPVERLRQALRDAIQRHVPDARAAGVLAALAVGDQAAIEREDWDLYRRTGIAHLMSISGLHVTMFAWLAGAMIGALWRRWPRGATALPSPVAGGWGGLIAATAYALLAGWGVPAQRTLLMLAVGVLWRSAGWRWPWPLVLLLAAVVVTALDPWALLQPGFWLSFAAVGLLMASETARPSSAARSVPGRLGGLLRSQAVATIGLAPLSLLFFQQVSLVGFIANLLAIPLVTLLITPLALLGSLLPPLWLLGAAAIRGLSTVLELLAGGPGALWTVAAAPAWGVACGLAGALLMVLPLPWRLRWLAVPLLLPMLWPPVHRPAAGTFELVAADVGQGTAVLVRTRGHLLVYDSGPPLGRDSDSGERVLLPLLRARGETRIHQLVLSHRDADHVGGAASLLAGLPVPQLLSSLEPGHALLSADRTNTRCASGQSWTWDGVHFELLHPDDSDYTGAPRRPNALSCVLRVVDGQGRSALLPGDIGAEEEAALLRRHPADRLHSDILLVPHHGSRSSSSEAFLRAVQPRVAVVQAGYRNRFGHPVSDVLARYAALGIPVVRTDRCGAWMWHDGAARCTREVRRRYWHWQAPESGADGGANVAIPSAGEGKQ